MRFIEIRKHQQNIGINKCGIRCFLWIASIMFIRLDQENLEDMERDTFVFSLGGESLLFD